MLLARLCRAAVLRIRMRMPLLMLIRMRKQIASTANSQANPQSTQGLATAKRRGRPKGVREAAAYLIVSLYLGSGNFDTLTRSSQTADADAATLAFFFTIGGISGKSERLSQNGMPRIAAQRSGLRLSRSTTAFPTTTLPTSILFTIIL
jgi:hypothetical protein